MNCNYCYLVIFIFKLFVALQGKWKKLFRFLQLLRAKLFPSPYIYEQTCSFSLQNYEQTCSLSLQIYEQGVQDFKIFNFGGLFLLTEASNEKEYNMGCLSFCPLFHPLEYRFPVLFPFKPTNHVSSTNFIAHASRTAAAGLYTGLGCLKAITLNFDTQ